MTRHITGVRKSKVFPLTQIVSVLVVSLVTGGVFALVCLYVDVGVSALYTGIGTAAFLQSFVGVMVCYYDRHHKALPGYVLGALLLFLACMINWSVEINSLPAGMLNVYNGSHQDYSGIYTFMKDYGSLLMISLSILIPPFLAVCIISEK